MSMTVTECDLERDRAMIVETLARHLTPQSDEARFDWLYMRNPAGRARAWVARDGDTRQVIGMAAAFPRLIDVGEERIAGWILGDFCIAGHARSLGPALTLQRACLEVVESGAGTLCYDFPSRQMMAVFRRLGIGAFKDVIRWAKPVRVDRKVTERLGESFLSSGACAVGNLALRVVDRMRKTDTGLEIAVRNVPCDDEFSKWSQEASEPSWILLARSPEYLNWRYRSHPLGPVEIVTARRFGTLVGYAAFSRTRHDGVIVDVCGGADWSVSQALIESLIALFRQRGVSTVSAHLVDGHPASPVFEACGFHPRERIPLVVHVSNKRPDLGRAVHTLDWLIMSGDRDT